MKRDLTFKGQFHRIVTDIELAGTPSGATEETGQNDA